MIPVEEALGRIRAALQPTGAEAVRLDQAFCRVLANDVAARVSQPPADVSAMDGYAVRGADVAAAPITLRRIGEAPAGGAFAGTVGRGEAVRIFTGGPMPAGADTVVLQENTAASGNDVVVREITARGRHVRAAGIDFRAGDIRLRAGHRLGARDIGLAAAMNFAELPVRRRPRVAILATGNELDPPGAAVGANRIANANGPALAALVTAAGGEAIDLGIARDDIGELERAADRARGADLLLTIGGASVGEHDLIQTALGRRGLAVDFWKVAIRPGKPLMFGKLGALPVLGLPGNPVSALVCALVFVRAAIAGLLGRTDNPDAPVAAVLGRDLGANDQRQDYLRSDLARRPDGVLVATPHPQQDSSMLASLAASGCLVVRAPNAPAAKAGDSVPVLAFGLGAEGY